MADISVSNIRCALAMREAVLGAVIAAYREFGAKYVEKDEQGPVQYLLWADKLIRDFATKGIEGTLSGAIEINDDIADEFTASLKRLADAQMEISCEKLLNRPV